ncbi:NADH dehydrogenase [Mycobacterium kyorinense]|uniref:NADH dehydrogenase n=1 Tax=Mycobacterium kyorinense TaxID=487514 RepID=A0A1A2YXW4_9MYCO|nr:NADH-ubiquinone oxidoreductase-F iron-sulfur binding region domain-containing protein [Mycobacterium kyorinense]OBI43129.1 NADH dehydrogenase [Mycobacterium kyorinense]
METTTTASAVTVAVWPGCEPRLLRDPPGREGFASYRESGGYRRLESADDLLNDVERSGLLGRGGAAYPLAVKLLAVRDNGRRGGSGAVVVANGEEGEPASIKDRWLLRNRPHLVLDGLRLAAAIVSADQVYVYMSDLESARSVESALNDIDSSALGDVSVDIRVVDPGYVAGEETAAVRALNGGPVKPTDKPPRPFQQGVGGRPTLVSNVETLANLPYLQRHGATAFRAQGTALSPGTFLMTITGAGRPAGLYEVPHGVAFPDLLALHGVSPGQVKGALMGGYFAGLLNRTVLDATMDHETLRGLGSGLGAGAVTVLTDDCVVAVAASVLAYFDRENAGQCGSCFNGTAAMAAVAAALRDGVATDEDLVRLRRWSVVLPGRGACATLDAACNVAASLLDQFPHAVERHRDNSCAACQAEVFHARRPYEVEPA